MTHEEFAHICLQIKNGADIPIPCCGNCKHYMLSTASKRQWFCFHPMITMQNLYDVLRMQPEDFCSRWEAKDGT